MVRVTTKYIGLEENRSSIATNTVFTKTSTPDTKLASTSPKKDVAVKYQTNCIVKDTIKNRRYKETSSLVSI